MSSKFLRLSLAAASSLFLGRAVAQVNVLTYHNDNARTGANTSEVVLAPSNVNTAHFGKLFSVAVDGQVYAEPLYVSNVTIPGKGVHNVVYVATENDTVYAFDADLPSSSTPNYLWKTTFVNGTTVTAVPANDLGTSAINTSSSGPDINPIVGITGTPVIDAASGTLYVVAKTREGSSPNYTYVQKLHALDITTGVDRSGSPVTLDASITLPGTGYHGLLSINDAVNGHIAFNPRTEHQRSALLLLNGVVYVVWASHEDADTYHGWMMGFDAGTLARVFTFSPTANGARGGIWQGGMGPAADSDGNIYVATGNGTYTSANPPSYGDSVLKISPTATSPVLDYFTPYNQSTLETNDTDLGSTGPIILPTQPGPYPDILVTGGKSKTMYVLNRHNLGGFHTGSDTGALQHIASAVGVELGAPAYWKNFLYFHGIGTVVYAYSISNGVVSSSPSSTSPTSWNGRSGTPTVSANGNTKGIVWIVQTTGARTPSKAATSAILHAYDATNLGTELYNTSQASGGRDALGGAVKFVVPTIANGRVFVGGDGQLDIVGPLAPAIISATAQDPGNVVVVQFDRVLASGPALQPVNYTLSNGATVTGATLSADGRTVTLATSQLQADVAYTLSVSGLQDTFTPPHTIGTGTTTTFTYTPYQDFSLTPGATVAAGGSIIPVTVSLAHPVQDGGLTLAITSDNAAATVPASLDLQPGATSASFDVTTSAVAAATTVNVSATLGSVLHVVSLTLQPYNLAYFSVTPDIFTGGTSTTGTLTLDNPAPTPMGAIVAVTSTDPHAIVPEGGAVVPAGQTVGTFAITTSVVDVVTPLTLTATLGANTIPFTISLTPLAGDLDRNGVFDVRDVVLAVQIAAGLADATSVQASLGDMNADGAIGLDDAVVLMRELNGL